MKNNTETFLSLFILVAVILSVINVVVIAGRFEKVSDAQALAQEIMRPAALQVISVVHPTCTSCYSSALLLDSLKSLNVNVTEERTVLFDSPEGQSLIDAYGLTYLPALVVSGEVNKSEQLSSFFTQNGYLSADRTHGLYSDTPAPFYDIDKKALVGSVSLHFITDSSCKECRSLDTMGQALKQMGVGVTSTHSYAYSSSEGKDLIQKHGITRVPAVVISQDIEAYPQVVQQLLQSGVILKNGAYVMITPSAPYREIKTDTVVGRVTLVMLKDETCTACYDVVINRQILDRFGMAVTTQETYDLKTTSAKALIDTYKITKIPTILVSPDAQYYPSFVGVWKSVGTVESDGWYIMRKPDVLGTHKDLSTGKIINPQEQAQQPPLAE